MDKIVFETEDGTVEFFVLDQTRIGGTDYILVTEEEEGDSDALILKDTSKDGDEEALYEIVEDERELSAVAEVFAKMDDDIAFE
ncbi:MAG: DUF1292 domain-containing protein [Lachnospiraceae bacterium]|jgi:hypothetical protein|nr:DUF1292 domain-containing protein [Lachnospiraceae bacterium]MBQ5375336.1 DUF1292 domain-containing protein [Lachnospiraceae bacterium]MBR1848323.1 DUF1292 domain-containing protein [Lachnospiraceae bacterium]MCR5320144.1 DUF1292 domain-containing protein [Lachnospiraceae bacterium]